MENIEFVAGVIIALMAVLLFTLFAELVTDDSAEALVLTRWGLLGVTFVLVLILTLSLI